MTAPIQLYTDPGDYVLTAVDAFTGRRLATAIRTMYGWALTWRQVKPGVACAGRTCSCAWVRGNQPAPKRHPLVQIMVDTRDEASRYLLALAARQVTTS